jgi:predicted small lipoprotein YifL
MKLNNVCALAMGFVLIAVFAIAGCGQRTGAPDASQVAGPEQEAEPTHGGWWCYEHGVPEQQCAMCDSKLAAELRKNGDWCEEHIRPDSLCFQCHPENAAKFVARYEAKYGKKPPEPAD